MERVILHCDINHCYAQIEEMKNPALKNIPMAVGGHEEERHGIILAKNLHCKKYGIKTAESLRDAYKKCPNLLIIPPHFDDYIYYTEQVKNIYREYSNRIESFGLDEAWVDITESISLYGSKEYIAETIKQRVLEEVGLTISVGVSFNKIFAKLGSDLIKPDGLVYITKENYKDVVWPLPVGELLYVGHATERKLKSHGIYTIGELANTPISFLRNKLGKMGVIINYFANGYDESEVTLCGDTDSVKSIGNSITTKRDINTFDEAIQVYYVLSESVASRARDINMVGSVISISARDVNLQSFTRQMKIDNPTNVSEDIMKTVKLLVQNNIDFQVPLRSIGVSLSSLQSDNGYYQMNLFDDTDYTRSKVLEETMDSLRNKYGFECIKRCSMLLYEDLTTFNPKEDNIVHPVGFF
ncbi:MAG: DNA polymerase IV [Erysipelotrichales bacterium]|nr:DNA polymerase IV [Erysipelotrichales bacterium]